MSSKDNAIEINCDSDESKTPTDNQVEVNPDEYEQPDIPSRVLGIGDEDFARLTYETKDIDLMRHQCYWIEQPEMASFVRVGKDKSQNVILLRSHSYQQLITNVRYFQNLSRSIHAT